MAMAAGGRATTRTTTTTGGVGATNGTTTIEGPGWDPIKLLISVIVGMGTVIMVLMGIIWHDLTSDIAKMKRDLEELSYSTTQLNERASNMATNINNTRTDIKDIQNDIKEVLSKQSNTEIQKAINSSTEEIIKSIRERPR